MRYERNFISSCLWFVLCCLSVVLCILLFSPIYKNWRENPTYTTVETTNYPIWDIYFPAVTICSNIQIKYSQMAERLKKAP